MAANATKPFPGAFNSREHFWRIFASVATIASALQSVTFAAGVFAGSMLWWVILTTLVSKTAALFRPSMLLWINRISGAVLVAFAVYGFTTLM